MDRRTKPAPLTFVTANVWPEHADGRWLLLWCGHDFQPHRVSGAPTEEARLKLAMLAVILGELVALGEPDGD